MTNKISLLLLFAASHFFTFAQEKPVKKVNYYLGTLPSVTNKLDPSQLHFDLMLRENDYNTSPTEVESDLKENYNQFTIPVLLLAEIKNNFTVVMDLRVTAFNYDATRNTENSFWANRNGFRSENVRGFGAYQYYGFGKSFRFLENKKLLILPHGGFFSGVGSSDYTYKTKLNDIDGELKRTVITSNYGVKTGIILNYDVSNKIAIGLNLDNIIGVQYNEVTKSTAANRNNFYSLSDEFSSFKFYLGLKF
ncbi:MAG: hypothetical protein MH472_02970 [Bacteroidia bacterium]|nr:hypothetical protein [Bacteroidia bacterium]